MADKQSRTCTSLAVTVAAMHQRHLRRRARQDADLLTIFGCFGVPRFPQIALVFTPVPGLLQGRLSSRRPLGASLAAAAIEETSARNRPQARFQPALHNKSTYLWSHVMYIALPPATALNSQ